MAQPHSVGRESLAAKLLGFSKDVDLDKPILDKFDPNDVASDSGLSHAAIKPHVYKRDRPARFHAQWNQGADQRSYRKLMAGVRDENGTSR